MDTADKFDSRRIRFCVDLAQDFQPVENVAEARVFSRQILERKYPRLATPQIK